MNDAKIMLKMAHALCSSISLLGQEYRDQNTFELSRACERMHRILNDSRLFERAVHRRWLLAADKIQHRLRRNLSDLYYDIQGLKTKLDQKIPTTPLLSELIAELMQLEDEFGQIQIDPKEKSISIVTDPVALEEVSLGSFEIKLFLERISRMHKEIPYRVIATDPNPAGSDSGVTHPHVSGEYLCEGDGHLPIRKALEQGRLCDFYNLVIGILNTYNPDSPYVRLEDWDGYSCYDCGRTMARDDSYYCERCENDYCSSCSSYCQICDVTLCLGCVMECPHCHKPVCPDCTSVCTDCRETFCRDCIEESGICQPCQEQRKDECDEDEQANTTAA